MPKRKITKGVNRSKKSLKKIDNYKDGKPKGQHSYTDAKGCTYVGDFKNGMPNGQGFFTHTSGANHRGSFKNGKPNGQGFFTSASGSTYEGDFKFGKRHGQGVYKDHSGLIYNGNYKFDERNGEGVLTFPDGASYTGEFKNGKYHGQGTYKNEALTFTGDFEENKPNGHGCYTFQDGGFYVGCIKNAYLHGQGLYTLPNGDTYHGEFINSMPNGNGCYTFQNGGTHTGEFKDGLYNGQGVHINSNGTTYEGIWKDDSLPEGKKTTKEGIIYKGEFKKFNNMIKEYGLGHWKYLDGSKIFTEITEEPLIQEDNNFSLTGTAFVSYPDGKKDIGKYIDGEFVFETELAKKIAAGETDTLEFKETFVRETNEKHPSYVTINKELLKAKVESVMALLNAKGGHLIIGVQDRPIKILGIDEEIKKFHKGNDDEFIRKVTDSIASEIGEAKMALYVTTSLVIENEKKLLVIDCKQSENPVFDKSGDFKARQMNSNKTFKGPELLDYISERFPSKDR